MGRYLIQHPNVSQPRELPSSDLESTKRWAPNILNSCTYKGNSKWTILTQHPQLNWINHASQIEVVSQICKGITNIALWHRKMYSFLFPRSCWGYFPSGLFYFRYWVKTHLRPIIKTVNITSRQNSSNPPCSSQTHKFPKSSWKSFQDGFLIFHIVLELI